MHQTAAAYAPFALFAVIAVAFAAINLTIGVLIRPRSPNPGKAVPYECGNEPADQAGGPTLPRYYFYAMLFVLFDVEVAFLVPWALGAGTLGLTGLAAAALFLAVLFLGYAYIWRKGDLEWD